MRLFDAPPTGTLAVEVEYHTEFTYYLTVGIRELGLREEINFEGKRFQVPPGHYTVTLSGLLGDPRYAGPQYAAFRQSYGSFERQEQVEVRSGEECVCRFAFMGEVHHVAVQVVAGGEPAIGAEVLVEGAGGGFLPVRSPEGILLHLAKGRYPLVVTYRDIMVKETIPVGDGERVFVIDLSRQLAQRRQLVVIRYLDGRMLKGATEDFQVGGLPFTVAPAGGGPVSVADLAGVKAIFFVKSLAGDPRYKPHKEFGVARQFGRRTMVVFRDGELQHGYTLPEHTDYPFFFLFPVDPMSNNDKVYVIREATREVRLL